MPARRTCCASPLSENCNADDVLREVAAGVLGPGCTSAGPGGTAQRRSLREHGAVFDLAKQRFLEDGFVVLPGLVADELTEGVLDAIETEFPTANDFHQNVDPERNARFRSEFGGITGFPCSSLALNVLAVHDRLIDLGAALLDDADLRAYSIEFWAKYSGAADYDQPFHRDYLNHSVVVPDADAPASQVEMFVYLSDVTDDVGPIAMLPRRHTGTMPALPNWYPRADGHTDADHADWTSSRGMPDWYEQECRAVGPAGTVIAYRIDSFHRGTALRRAGGARYTIHTNFRRADHDWIGRRSWADSAADDPAWTAFVTHATTRQLSLFGFPRPGHPYWNDTTRRGIAQRYPGVDPDLWA